VAVMAMHPVLVPIFSATPVFLAPMSGVSDLPFRRMVRRFGADLVFSEMIVSHIMLEAVRSGALGQGQDTDYASEFPVAVQLAGCEPDVMAEAARINVDRGAAVIDINFGCPVKKIVNNYAGSALMRDEELATRIMAAVRDAVPDNVPVTVKMRLGWDEQTLNAPILAQRAEALGLKMVTIHGRTRNQMYNGTADWNAVRAVKDSVTIPVIVNGDVDGPDNAREALAQSGADGVMIGRGAYGKPWIVQQTRETLSDGAITTQPPQDTALGAVILEHYEMMLGHYGTHQGVQIARKHLGWYAEGRAGAENHRKRINAMVDPGLVREEIRAYYGAA
jgi:tRNA-dihydrouridine synthase B